MPWETIDRVRTCFAITGQGTPVVLLHGLQGDLSNFAGLVPGLAERHRVLAFDQRGSGWTDKPAQRYSTARYADDTARLMDALEIDRAHVFGVSMGGMVAQEFALRHPQRLRRLVLGCTTAGGPRAVTVESESRESAYEASELTAEERARRFAEAGFSPGFVPAHPEVLQRLIAARRERPLDVRALARRRRALEAHDTSRRLADIAASTLVITGLQDRVVSPENSRQLARALPSARLETLDPAGHLFWIERPQETLALLLSFLAEDD
ncbi:MAG TPA: alpha/beta hydrolase [Gammaproteobacteria bacterium]|nr:alpha/beta hydrolase [Gammaproteobacteria bacterium]